METLDEKMEFMSKLGLLSGAEKDFKNINVTDDYTMVTMAKEKSKNETNDYVWKARGSPRIGMRFIRIKHC